MVLSFIHTASRLLVFGGGLLLGIQVPAYVDQYSQRVDAHFREVSANIAGFQRTADEMFEGDLRALVDYYRQSNDPVFRSDADSVQSIVDRYVRIGNEYRAMQGNVFAVATHVLFFADDEMSTETRNQYSYTVPLNGIAMQWGFAVALLVFLLLELSVAACAGCARLVRGRHAHHPH
jgi:hypothetical protein